MRWAGKWRMNFFIFCKKLRNYSLHRGRYLEGNSSLLLNPLPSFPFPLPFPPLLTSYQILMGRVKNLEIITLNQNREYFVRNEFHVVLYILLFPFIGLKTSKYHSKADSDRYWIYNISILSAMNKAIICSQ